VRHDPLKDLERSRAAGPFGVELPVMKIRVARMEEPAVAVSHGDAAVSTSMAVQRDEQHLGQAWFERAD